MKILQTIFCLGLFSLTIGAVELKVTKDYGGAIFVIVDGKSKFQYRHRIYSFSKENLHLTQQNQLFAYAVNYNLVVLDGAKKQIVKRVIFPGRISNIKWKSNTSLEVTVKVFSKQVPYTISLTENTSHIPPCGALLGYRFDRVEVFKEIEPLGLYEHKKVKKIKKAKKIKKVSPNEIKKRLQELAKFDIYNPWVGFYSGLFELRFGSAQKAVAIWKQVQQSSHARWYHLFPMGAVLHFNNDHKMGNAFHKAGMQQLYKSGLEPRMIFSLISMIIHKGGLAKKIEEYRKQGKWQEASLLLEELYEYSPRCEAFYMAMTKFALHLEKAGEAKLAKTWHKRAKPAQSFNFLAGGTGINPTMFSLCMTIVGAAKIAFFLFLLIMLLGSSYLSFVCKNRYGNLKYRLLSKVTLVSMLSGVICAFVFFIIVASGIRAIDLVANLPIEGLSKMDHPQALDWIEKAPESPAKHFYRALCFQTRKEYKKAREEYGKATQFAQTYNNLALIDQAEGKDPQANLQKALAINPKLPEGHWNLHKKAISLWAKVHQEYAPKQAMLAVPTGEMHKQFLFQLGAWPLNPHFSLGYAYSLGYSKKKERWTRYITLVSFVFIFVGLILSLFCPCAPEEEARRPITWWLSFFVPGSSRLWSVFGFAVAWLWVTSALIFSLQINSPNFYFLSILDSMAMPNLSSVYGVDYTIPDAVFRHQVVSISQWLFYLLPVVNFVLLFLEKKKEDASA